MTRLKLLILALVAFSLLFIGWLLLGSYFWRIAWRGIAILCFLLAFISVLGQFVMLALTLKEHMRQRLANSSKSSQIS